jgi:hypothetical protein
MSSKTDEKKHFIPVLLHWGHIKAFPRMSPYCPCLVQVPASLKDVNGKVSLIALSKRSVGHLESGANSCLYKLNDSSCPATRSRQETWVALYYRNICKERGTVSLCGTARRAPSGFVILLLPCSPTLPNMQPRPMIIYFVHYSHEV